MRNGLKFVKIIVDMKSLTKQLTSELNTITDSKNPHANWNSIKNHVSGLQTLVEEAEE